jgi:hypothetical protein
MNSIILELSSSISLKTYSASSTEIFPSTLRTMPINALKSIFYSVENTKNNF